MKIFRCKVSGLVNDAGDVMPVTVLVDAMGVATAKLEAAFNVNGYWTDDSDCEIVAVLNSEDGVQYPKVLEVQPTV